MMIEILKAVAVLLGIIAFGGVTLWFVFWTLKKIFHLDD
jgi:hypothetical protein